MRHHLHRRLDRLTARLSPPEPNTAWDHRFLNSEPVKAFVLDRMRSAIEGREPMMPAPGSPDALLIRQWETQRARRGEDCCSMVEQWALRQLTDEELYQLEALAEELERLRTSDLRTAP